MSSTSKAGIQTSADGTSYIPASTRADGTTRKQIKVRPGYRPPEDVETYKNRSAEAWKNRDGGGVPGAEIQEKANNNDDAKSKNVKRREAAKRKKDSEAATTTVVNSHLAGAMEKVDIGEQAKLPENWKGPLTLADDPELSADVEAERQKKIRNQLKKLRAVLDLKEKKASGVKLSHDQLLKIGKEDELLRDLKKLNYDGPEMTAGSEGNAG